MCHSSILYRLVVALLYAVTVLDELWSGLTTTKPVSTTKTYSYYGSGAVMLLYLPMPCCYPSFVRVLSVST